MARKKSDLSRIADALEHIVKLLETVKHPWYVVPDGTALPPAGWVPCVTPPARYTFPKGPYIGDPILPVGPTCKAEVGNG